MTKEVKAKEPTKEVKTKTIEEQVEGLTREIAALSEEARSCQSEISRATDDETILTLDGKLRIAVLKKAARENRLKELAQELGKQEKEAAFVQLQGLRKERRAALEKGWKLTREALKTIEGLWKIYKEIVDCNASLGTTEAAEDVICKRWGFTADQILVSGRATITCPTGKHLPGKTRGGLDVWIQDLLNFKSGKTSLYDASEFDKAEKEK